MTTDDDLLPADPWEIPKYNAGRLELEVFLLFAVLVAGKRSDVQREKLIRFLTHKVKTGTGFDDLILCPVGRPFDWIRRLDTAGVLRKACKKHKLGKYSTIVPGFRQIAQDAHPARGTLDLTDTSTEELQRYPGIGPKTAAFFLINTDREAARREVALDTHILSFLDEAGVEGVPDDTPPGGPTYDRLKRRFVEEAEARGLTPGELDREVWQARTESSV